MCSMGLASRCGSVKHVATWYVALDALVSLGRWLAASRCSATPTTGGAEKRARTSALPDAVAMAWGVTVARTWGRGS